MDDIIKKYDSKCTRGSSITHAQNTCTTNTQQEIDALKLSLGLPLSDLRVIIDWFSVTFKKDLYDVQFILDLLTEFIDFPEYKDFNESVNFHHESSDFLKKESPFQHNLITESGYKQSIMYGNIIIFYDSYGGKIERGYKLSFSGQGCRTFELLLKDGKTWLNFFRKIIGLDTNITRIDLAVDDFSEYLPIDDVRELLKAKRLVSRLKTWAPSSEYDISSGKAIIDGINIGSRRSRSRIMFRLYDKALQMEVPFYWNRLEAEIKNENATNAVLRMLEINTETAISEVTLGIINNYLRFCELEQTDSNRSRWTVWSNWVKFINDVPKIKIGIEIPKSNIDTKLDWLYKQPPKSIAQVMMSIAGTTELTDHVIDENIDFLKSLLLKGYDSLETKDIKLVEQHLELKQKTNLYNIDSLLDKNIITLQEYNNIKAVL